MELILEQNLPHQQKAVDAVCDALEGVYLAPPAQFYENPSISLNSQKLYSNIKNLQSALSPELRNEPVLDGYLNLDIKMETGTGKTYVYSKTIFELHKRYGLNKFIIIVPSLPIKAGTGQFLEDGYVRRHFRDDCGYGVDIEFGILEAQKKKKGRTYFPSVVSEFIKGSCQNKNKIYVLLMNMQLLTGAKVLTRSDYDFGVEGFYRPLDGLRATHPVVLLDEPHRFTRGQKAMEVIEGDLQPQMVIRFGATFPETTTGKGKKKTTIKDYRNLLYDLNACTSFNSNLIKGVSKEHFEPVSKRDEKVKILRIISKDSVVFQHKYKSGKSDESKSYTLKTGDSMSLIADALEGITITAIGKSEVEFSNGLVKTTGEELEVDIYMTSYQEQMLRLAVERHLETERQNFTGRKYRIKTLALFFIDDISSYRSNKEGKKPYLLEAFERLLKEQIEKQIKKLTPHESEYRDYLEASLADISSCHAGYFSQDNDDSDDEIAKEVSVILHGKKQLLSFTNADGSYNTLRFLFSKWTLREGWDNPNVFTIAKLRSSGSENSKLQEVGRGLRLPVDERGNRISNEEFELNYIVDFTEADFADRLVAQINQEAPAITSISEERLEVEAKKMGIEAGALFAALLRKGYIDWKRNIIPEKQADFFAEYPAFNGGVNQAKVKDRNKEKSKPVKIRKARYNELKELWQAINQRYLMFYDWDIDAKLEDVILDIFENGHVFAEIAVSSVRTSIRKQEDNTVGTFSRAGVQYIVERPLAYHEFLKQIMRATNIPIHTTHKALCAYAQKHGGTIAPNKINEATASAFCTKFLEWKFSELQSRIRIERGSYSAPFHYSKSSTSVGATALTYADGSPLEEIAQGRIGTKIKQGEPSAKYLYDTIAFDSPLEEKNIDADIESVVVYGKIPRNSVAIPTFTGATYSPDFMYVVQKANGEKELNIVIETKDVENKTELRGTEEAKIQCARVFFENLTLDGYKVYFRDQLNNKQMIQIIRDVLDAEA